MKGYFREKSKSQNRNPISPTTNYLFFFVSTEKFTQVRLQGFVNEPTIYL